VADVRPFRALRYDPQLDISSAICPPFDTISPEQQRALYDSSPYNAVRIELAEEGDGGRYESAARTLRAWIAEGILRRDGLPGFYLYRQRFKHDRKEYTRTLLFARLRLVPWEEGVVLPHEQTFGGPKEDRLQLMRAARLNASPVFLFYRDGDGDVSRLLEHGGREQIPLAEFAGPDGQEHTLVRMDEPGLVEQLTTAFQDRRLYIADGHHRYETALGYRDEVRAQAAGWTGDEPENFALVALAAAEDPGLLVLPIHRVTNIAMPLQDALTRLQPLFDVAATPEDPLDLAKELAKHRDGTVVGLAAADLPELRVLTVSDPAAVDGLLPQERSEEWRRLDYAIANHVVLRYGLGLDEAQMSDYSFVWFTEDPREAVHSVRDGRATYAVLLNPVAVERVLALADAGERMPQKSTFFYPKVPTGLVFNLLEK
jgi:uncharacterized protein (DUF1015 family)